MAAEDEHEHCDCADHLERHHRVEAASGGQFKEGSIWAALFGTGTKAPTTSQIREEDQRCDEACIPAVVGPSRCGRGGYRAGDGGHYKVPIGSLAGQDGYGPGQGGYGPGGYGPGGYGPGGYGSGGYGSGGNGPGGNGPGGNGPGGYGPGGYGAGRGGYGPDGHGAGRDGYGSGQAGGRRRAHGPGGYGPGKSGYGPGQGGYKRGHGKYGRGQYGAEAEGADGGVGGEAKRRTASDFLIPIIGGGLLFLTLVALLNRQFDVVSVVKSTADEVKKQIMNSLCETNEKGSGSFSGIGGGGVGGGGGGGPGRSGSRDPCFHAKADKNNPCGNLKIRIHPERRKYQDPPHPDGIRALFPTIPGLHDCEDKEETPEEGVFTDPN